FKIEEELPQVLLPVQRVAQQQRAAVINLPTDIPRFKKVVNSWCVVDEDALVPEVLAPTVNDVSAGSCRVHKRAIGESLRRNRTVPVITDGVGPRQSVDNRQRTWLIAVHDDARVNIEKRAPAFLSLNVGLADSISIIVDEALHVRRRSGERNRTRRRTRRLTGRTRRVELLHIDMVVRLVGIGKRCGHVRSSEYISQLAVGPGITH